MSEVVSLRDKPESKELFSKVGYEEGDFPWVCGTCASYEGGTMLCSIVQGPYDGRVSPQDTCKRWSPGEGLRKR